MKTDKFVITDVKKCQIGELVPSMSKEELSVGFFDLWLFRFIRKYIWGVAPFIIYWCWGGEFVRGVGLGWTTLWSIGVLFLCKVIPYAK